MSKFYTTLSQDSSAGTTDGGTSSSPTIELVGDVVAYGPLSEVVTSLAPTGVVPGIYTTIKVNEKGQVVQGFASEANANFAIQTFKFFLPSKRWRVVHNMGTRDFTEAIKNSEGRPLYANVTIIDLNEAWVEFTEEESGTITIIFDLGSSRSQYLNSPTGNSV